MSTDKESSVAGTDNRPPMLVESDYESWKIRIERYIRLGKLIWRSIQNGPTPHPQITVTEGQGEDAVQVTRDKRDEEFTEIENNKELADIQANHISHQGAPKHTLWAYDGQVSEEGDMFTTAVEKAIDSVLNVGGWAEIVVSNGRRDELVTVMADMGKVCRVASADARGGEEEHLDSDVESDIDDNTIPYHQYQLDSEVQDVPTEVTDMRHPSEISP
ncbi:hypothetical protein Tco_1132538 [Tanacetum coccineum]|uniref:DUF4219 domain-containing protein n=1 Tax=Tanacetum coccineum TaxID=301880 RepID=A0ABQ5JEZ5_9ASTR